MEKPLVNEKFLLKKMPGKGGWTYADLPQVTTGKNVPFGWVRVKGTIDGIVIEKYNLMPYGQGKLFLPVRAEIRKKIKKEAGDYVHVVLYPDNEPTIIPEEMKLALEDEPEALEFFHSLKENEKQRFIKWINAAKTEETIIERIAHAVNCLVKGLKSPHKPQITTGTGD
jgi:hypothetical protein